MHRFTKNRILMSPEGDAGGGGAAPPLGAGAAPPGSTPPPPAGAAPNPPPAQPPPPGSTPPPMIPEPGERGQFMPAPAFKKFKQEQRQKGKAELTEELNKQAKAKGYASYAEMLAATPAASAQPPPPAPKPDDDDEDDDPPEDKQQGKPPPAGAPKKNANKDRQRFEEERKARQIAERKLRESQNQLAAREARAQLEQIFVREGVTDVDYAINLIERETATLDEATAAAFDEKAWLARLRTTRPHLFGETPRPVDTAPRPPPTGGQPPANPPPPGQPPAPQIKPGDLLAVDPKTGRYVVGVNEKTKLFNQIVKDAQNGKVPVLTP